MTNSSDSNDGLADIVDQLDNVDSDSDQKTTVGDIVNSFGGRAYAPLIIIPAVIALFPITGGIPGMSIFTATVIILVTVQMLVTQGTIWLPEFIRQREISKKRLSDLSEKWQGRLRWVDRWFQKRMVFLTESPFNSVLAILCIVLSLTMYPLAFVPMGAAPPSFAIMLIGLSLLTKDGLLAIIGSVSTLVSFVATGYLVTIFWSEIQESWQFLFGIG